MSTTWNTEGTTGGSWSIESGGIGTASSVASTYATGGMSFDNLSSIGLLDDSLLTFGSDSDYSISYDSVQDRLEFNNISGTTLLAITTTGFLLNSVNLIELSSLPTATEGSLVYYNNELYLGT